MVLLPGRAPIRKYFVSLAYKQSERDIVLIAREANVHKSIASSHGLPLNDLLQVVARGRRHAAASANGIALKLREQIGGIGSKSSNQEKWYFFVNAYQVDAEIIIKA
jgi:hypothetical protein